MNSYIWSIRFDCAAKNSNLFLPQTPLINFSTFYRFYNYPHFPGFKIMLFFYTDTLQNVSSSNFYIQSRKQNLHDSAIASLTLYYWFQFEIPIINNEFWKKK